jgi:hypothetical protein
MNDRWSSFVISKKSSKNWNPFIKHKLGKIYRIYKFQRENPLTLFITVGQESIQLY